MILSTFSPEKRQIRLLSIPRDTISYIPKVGYYDKITHAHAYGGPTAAMDSVDMMEGLKWPDFASSKI